VSRHGDEDELRARSVRGIGFETSDSSGRTGPECTRRAKRRGSLGLRIPILAAIAIASTPIACTRPSDPDRVQGVVSAATPEAAATGVEILALGGNAFDAAVAITLALGVTAPPGSGIGGQAIWVVQPAGREPLVIDGSTRAPRALPEEVDSSDLVGRRASTVPTTLLVLEAVFERFGSGRVPWDRLVAPSITLAEQGHRPGPFRRSALARFAGDLAEDPTTASIFLDPAGAPREQLRNPDLADTLRQIARRGVHDFYRGEIAERIAADMQRHGGWITLEDLASARIELRAPLHARYRELDVYTLPPPAGGWVVLRALRLLERSPSSELAVGSPTRVLRFAEALRDAHAARVEHPVRRDEDPDAAISRRLDPGLMDAAQGQGTGESASLSLNGYFGSRVTAPGLGFLYNDYMREFRLDEADHPYALRPGAHPYSSMSATLVSTGGQPRLALGSPGSRRIISAVVQVVSGWRDAGMPLADAISAPRIHVIPERSLLMLEERPAAATLALEELGLALRVPITSLGRTVHAVMRVGERWSGAADPRRDGVALEARSPVGRPTGE
jgi:gamma-glutamyltranspeptidase/glutathione hydrolase